MNLVDIVGLLRHPRFLKLLQGTMAISLALLFATFVYFVLVYGHGEVMPEKAITDIRLLYVTTGYSVFLLLICLSGIALGISVHTALAIPVVVSYYFFQPLFLAWTLEMGQCFADATDYHDVAFNTYMAWAGLGSGDPVDVGVCRGLVILTATLGHVSIAIMTGAIVSLALARNSGN